MANVGAPEKERRLNDGGHGTDASNAECTGGMLSGAAPPAVNNRDPRARYNGLSAAGAWDMESKAPAYLSQSHSPDRMGRSFGGGAGR